MENAPEGNIVPGGEEKIALTKDEYDKLVNGTTSMKEELIELRKKNRELASQPIATPEDITKAVDVELKKREQEGLKDTIAQATNDFTAAHPEFSPENDKDGLNLAAYQRALGRMNLQGVKSYSDYMSVLEDALRLTERPVSTSPMQNFSTPRSVPGMPGVKPGAQLPVVEQKLAAEKFNGDVEAYLKWKAKHPEIFAEIVKYV